MRSSLAWRSALLAVQTEMQFRANFVLGFLRTFVGLTVMLFLWNKAYSQADAIAGLAYNDMVTYYIAIYAFSPLLNLETDWELWADIKYGRLSHYLLLPINYYWYTTARKSGAVSANLVLFPLLLLYGQWFTGANCWPPFSVPKLVLFLVALINAALIARAISFLRGVLGFWFEEVGLISWLDQVIISLLSGKYFPLSLLMRTAYNSLWVVALTGLVKYSWSKGVSRYQAAGG